MRELPHMKLLEFGEKRVIGLLKEHHFILQEAGDIANNIHIMIILIVRHRLLIALMHFPALQSLRDHLRVLPRYELILLTMNEKNWTSNLRCVFNIPEPIADEAAQRADHILRDFLQRGERGYQHQPTRVVSCSERASRPTSHRSSEEDDVLFRNLQRLREVGEDTLGIVLYLLAVRGDLTVLAVPAELG